MEYAQTPEEGKKKRSLGFYFREKYAVPEG
jgi:hypothetical protein